MAVVNTTAKQQKQGALIAGIGALVSIAAFLLLPYFNITATGTSNNGGNSSQTNIATIPAGTGFISILTGLIWIDALLAIAILVITALVMWRDVPFSSSTSPVEVQIRRAAYAVLILGVAGIAFHFLFFSIGSSQINNFVQSLTFGSISVASQLARSNSTLSVSMDNAIGSWIYIAGMGVAIVGGVLILRALSPQAVAQPQSWPQFPQYSQPSQPEQPQLQGWQQPSQPQPQIWQPTNPTNSTASAGMATNPNPTARLATNPTSTAATGLATTTSAAARMAATASSSVGIDLFQGDRKGQKRFTFKQPCSMATKCAVHFFAWLGQAQPLL